MSAYEKNRRKDRRLRSRGRGRSRRRLGISFRLSESLDRVRRRGRYKGSS